MREKFYSPEAKSDNKAESRRPTVWKKVKQLGQAAAFVTLGIIAEGKAASAQETMPQKTPNLQEWVKKAQESEASVERSIKIKGQAGKIGKMEARRWISPVDGSQTTVGYNVQGKETLIMNQTADGSRLTLDRDNDGSVDCLIINEQPSSFRGAGQNKDKIAFNELSALTSPDDVAATAEVEADLDPQEKEIYYFEEDADGKPIVKKIDFKTGEASQVDDEIAKKYTEVQQFNWSNTLGNIDQQIQK